jgi:hypothetical protein
LDIFESRKGAITSHTRTTDRLRPGMHWAKGRDSDSINERMKEGREEDSKISSLEDRRKYGNCGWVGGW